MTMWQLKKEEGRLGQIPELCYQQKAKGKVVKTYEREANLKESFGSKKRKEFQRGGGGGWLKGRGLKVILSESEDNASKFPFGNRG